jgi:hypothetical protein
MSIGDNIPTLDPAPVPFCEQKLICATYDFRDTNANFTFYILGQNGTRNATACFEASEFSESNVMTTTLMYLYFWQNQAMNESWWKQWYTDPVQSQYYYWIDWNFAPFMDDNYSCDTLPNVYRVSPTSKLPGCFTH